jgi:hypothetical protein
MKVMIQKCLIGAAIRTGVGHAIERHCSILAAYRMRWPSFPTIDYLDLAAGFALTRAMHALSFGGYPTFLARTVGPVGRKFSNSLRRNMLAQLGLLIPSNP